MKTLSKRPLAVASLCLLLTVVFHSPLIAQYHNHDATFVFPRTSAEAIPRVNISRMYTKAFLVDAKLHVVYTLREVAVLPDLSNVVVEYRKSDESSWLTGDSADSWENNEAGVKFANLIKSKVLFFDVF